MKFLKLKPIGLRNIKTSIAVLICLLLIKGNPIFAAVAAVICMQDTVEHSVNIGKIRLIGTLTGGILGIILLGISQNYNLHEYVPIITALGVSITIYTCNLINKPQASAISSFVFISIMLAPSSNNPINYALNRTLETGIGIIIAILVNKYFNPTILIKKDTNFIDK